MNGLSTELQIRSVDDLARISNVMAKCGYFKDATDSNKCAVKVLAGLEMGIPPFAAMTDIHIVNGKPAIGAGIIAAKIKNSQKYDYKILKHDDTVCELEFFENNKSVGLSCFSMDDAAKAQLSTGVNANTWSKYTRNMLFSRSISNGRRWYCPDLFLGAPVYTPEELDVVVDEEGNPVASVESKPKTTKFEFNTYEVETKPVSAPTALVLNEFPAHEKLVDEFNSLILLGTDPDATWGFIKSKYNVSAPAELTPLVLSKFIEKFKSKTVEDNQKKEGDCENENIL
jgi:hypothetical protein